MLKEFKEFAMKGNLVDMAVGLTLGAAFGLMAASFVKDVFSPPLGLLLGGADFSNQFVVLREGITPAPPGGYPTPAAAQEAKAVVLTYGMFLNAVINFLIVAVAMFMVVKAMNRLKKKEEAAPAPPPEPTAEVRLLTEIRDLLRR
jgi:large conductance mechanosensitive channel